MASILIISLSAIVGALMRYFTVVAATKLWGDAFPWGTLTVNLLGCLAIGLAQAMLESRPHAEWWLRHGVMIGLLGSLTTFSAFSLDTMKQLETGNLLNAAANVLLNVLGCMALVWLGLRIGRAIW